MTENWRIQKDDLKKTKPKQVQMRKEQLMTGYRLEKHLMKDSVKKKENERKVHCWE